MSDVVAERAALTGIAQEHKVPAESLFLKSELVIERICQNEDFARLRWEWNDLIRRSRSNTIFLTWEWLYIWWKFFGKGRELWILTIRDQHSRLIGIAPLFLETRQHYSFFHTHRLRFLGSETVGSDYLDFIIESGKEPWVIQAITNYLVERGDSWDVVAITDISATSLNLSLLVAAVKKAGCWDYQQDGYLCPVVNLPCDFETYLVSLSSNSRQLLRRAMRKLSERHRVEVRVCNRREDLDINVERFFDLHQQRWQRNPKADNFHRQYYREFHQEVMRLLLEKGYLRLMFLLVDGQSVAVEYNICYGEKMYYYQSGFDPAWAKQAVAKVLMGYCIKYSIETGLREFDLLRGAEDYKLHWTKDSRNTVHYSFARKGTKGFVAVLLSAVIDEIKGRIKRLIPSKRDSSFEDRNDHRN